MARGRITRGLAVILAGTLAASPALARCPATLADAATGFYVDFGTFVTRYDRRPDGTVEEFEVNLQGPAYRYLTTNGVFILESWELEGGYRRPGTGELNSFDTALPRIGPGVTWTGNSVVTYGNEPPMTQTLSLNAGAVTQSRIGDCTLATQTIELRSRTAGDNEDHVARFTYLPDLGVGLFVSGGFVSEAATAFTPVGISMDPPMAMPGAAPGPAPGPGPATPPVPPQGGK